MLDAFAARGGPHHQQEPETTREKTGHGKHPSHLGLKDLLHAAGGLLDALAGKVHLLAGAVDAGLEREQLPGRKSPSRFRLRQDVIQLPLRLHDPLQHLLGLRHPRHRRGGLPHPHRGLDRVGCAPGGNGSRRLPVRPLRPLQHLAEPLPAHLLRGHSPHPSNPTDPVDGHGAQSLSDVVDGGLRRIVADLHDVGDGVVLAALLLHPVLELEVLQVELLPFGGHELLGFEQVPRLPLARRTADAWQPPAAARHRRHRRNRRANAGHRRAHHGWARHHSSRQPRPRPDDFVSGSREDGAELVLRRLARQGGRDGQRGNAGIIFHGRSPDANASRSPFQPACQRPPSSGPGDVPSGNPPPCPPPPPGKSTGWDGERPLTSQGWTPEKLRLRRPAPDLSHPVAREESPWP
ncbi:hypothetical protein STIAU_7684 [Stigmatella aurantiaca DW4/3-1]|uniref:Uncharacterized protein n=1 Tax=Stigmatella aurantiaca (strain DW4/3-1) TaxID=378806 RepID=Q08R92_STIAD|nr:hypothetical protein STIAU_7684 [Stigmatella aurantiaca DW4/3-1]